jgi:hypothetical protein
VTVKFLRVARMASLAIDPHVGRMNRQRAVITKDGAKEIGAGTIVNDPTVGNRLELFLDNGKIMLTSVVRNIVRHGQELVVDTANSRYRLRFA